MQPFVVNPGALPSGKSELLKKADIEFFGSFGNEEILGADVDVEMHFNNHGVTLDLNCILRGTVTVPCDRCLEDLTIPVETEFDESYVRDGNELDLSQDIYDYVMTSLPLQRVHPEGECNRETVKMISETNNI